MELRAHSYLQTKRIAKAKKMSEKTAPYGFCLVQGKRVEEPKEQATLKLILKWGAEGISHCGIADRLNSKRLKPRKADKWGQPTIGYIIKRNLKKK